MLEFNQVFSTGFLSATVLMALLTLYLIRKARQRHPVDRLVRYFLYFISFHACYVLAIALFFEADLFYDAGAPFSFFYGPFLLLLAQNRKQDFYLLRLKNLLHFIPGLCCVLVFICLVILGDQTRDLQKYYLYFLYVISGVQMLVYAVYAYTVKIDNQQDSALYFLKKLIFNAIFVLIIVGLLAVSVVVSIDLRVENRQIKSGTWMHLLMLLTVLLVFRQYVYRIMEATNPIASPEELLLLSAKGDKYQKSKVSEADLAQYCLLLEELDRKIYLDSNLNLELLALKLKVPKYHLTQVFSLGLQTNFSKYVNAIRIEYAEKLLSDPRCSLSLDDIAFKSGFNSKSSFYRSFKEQLDLSPSEYRNLKMN